MEAHKTWDWIEFAVVKTCPVCGTAVKEEWDCNYQHPYFCPSCDEFRSEEEVKVDDCIKFSYQGDLFKVATAPMQGYDAFDNPIPNGVAVIGVYKEDGTENLIEGRWRPADDDLTDAVDVAIEMLNCN